MAVYKRTYAAYEGDTTPEWSRFLVVARASYARVSQSRLLQTLRSLSFVFPLLCFVWIYVANNLSILNDVGGPMAANFLSNTVKVDISLFQTFCWVQGFFAYVLTAFVGPTLVSPDLVNNGLPLYLCRPFSRTEYVAGKMSVLLILLSVVTWIPGLILFTVQGLLAGWDWTTANWRIAVGLFVGQLLWILVLSLIALAVSAWVKWRIAGAAVLLGIFIAGAGFGGAINQIVRTDYGSLLNLRSVMSTIWAQLFGRAPDTGLEAPEAWAALLIVYAACLVLLWRKVRPHEVVK